MTNNDTPSTLISVIVRDWHNWNRLQRLVFPAVLILIWPVATGGMIWSADIHKWFSFRQDAVDIWGTLNRSWYQQGGRFATQTGPWGDISYTILGESHQAVMRIGVEDHRSVGPGGDIRLRYAKKHPEWVAAVSYLPPNTWWIVSAVAWFFGVLFSPSLVKSINRRMAKLPR